MAAINPVKFLQEVRQEVSKVTWPTRQETVISTAMVLVMVTLVSLVLSCGRPDHPAIVHLILDDPADTNDGWRTPSGMAKRWYIVQAY